MSLSAIAEENLGIYKRGHYTAPSNRTVQIGETLQRAQQGTVLYRPEELSALLANATSRSLVPPVVEISAETTGTAIRRLIVDEGDTSVVALNFASARNPGGGFLSGAKSQEEDLCRVTGLYACLIKKPVYYDANRAQRSALYTDHIIYSPDVPVIRDEARRLLEVPFLASFITAPAPNAGAIFKNTPSDRDQILPTFARRARYILSIAAAQGHRTVVLGAWGCGAFRNDPNEVAPVLYAAAIDPVFHGAFDRIVFAIYDNSKAQNIYRAFADAINGN